MPAVELMHDRSSIDYADLWLHRDRILGHGVTDKTSDWPHIVWIGQGAGVLEAPPTAPTFSYMGPILLPVAPVASCPQRSEGPGVAARNLHLRRLLWVTCAAALVPLVPFLLIGELPGDEWLRATGRDSATFALAGGTLLASDLLLPIPSSIIGALLGARLGFLWGFMSAWAGLCLGSLLGYGVGRLAPRRWRSSQALAPALPIVFITRPVPVLAEAVAITAGVQGVGLVRFAAASAAGNALYAAAMAGNGAALLPDGLVGVGLLAPMGVPVAAWLAWRWRRGRRRPGRLARGRRR